MDKIKLAVYWASSCGGCDIAIVELGEHLLELEQVADLVFWPAAMDFKYRDVEEMLDGSIDVTLFNGGIRTESDARIARLLRTKSKYLIAFGSCAMEGCIPALANVQGIDRALQRAAIETPSTVNPSGALPTSVTLAPEGELTLPMLCDLLRPLGQIVPVDYTIPGCPPNHDQVWSALQAVLAGSLPARGTLLGVDRLTVCDQCPRVRSGKVRIDRFRRTHELIPDTERCLLEQGLVCAGPATHAGCGALCVKANMPCRGCYGPPEGVADQGAALLGAIVAAMDGQSDAETQRVLGTIVDPVGTFYRFSLGTSFLQQLKASALGADTCDAQGAEDDA